MLTKDIFKVPEYKAPEATYIDRSDLEAVATCPHQGHLRKQHEGEFETFDELPVVGQLVHEVAKMAIDNAESGIQEASDLIANELPKARPDLQPEILRAGKSLANQILGWRSNSIMLHEQQITRTLFPASGDRGEVEITTAPDLVLATSSKQRIVVLDYKTGYKSRTNADAANEFQTCVICWILFALYEPVETIDFWYLETRLNNKAYARMTREKDELNLQARIETAYRYLLEKSQEAWPVTEKCGMCPVIRFCKHITGEIVAFSKDPAGYLEAYIVLDASLKKLREPLDAAVKAGRTIYCSTGRFDGDPKKKSAIKPSFKADK